MIFRKHLSRDEWIKKRNKEIQQYLDNIGKKPSGNKKLPKCGSTSEKESTQHYKVTKTGLVKKTITTVVALSALYGILDPTKIDSQIVEFNANRGHGKYQSTGVFFRGGEANPLGGNIYTFQVGGHPVNKFDKLTRHYTSLEEKVQEELDKLPEAQRMFTENLKPFVYGLQEAD